jgi:diaminohydroxyphosphoribosylaminopyrimidine deaminase/5-amino-6-(5-phosphoribosylamino)uracil reductase
MVGINTVLKDDPGLNAAIKSKNIKKIILDSTLKIPTKAKLFKGTKPSSVLIVTTSKAPKAKIDALRKQAMVLVSPSKNGHVDLKWLWKELGRMGVSSVLIEGGARVIGRALKRGLVDKFFIFIAPKIIGDQQALSSIEGLQLTNLSQAAKLTNLTVYKIDEDIFIQGYVHRNR